MNSLEIIQPTYTLTLPSNGKEITYRPYLVKENRILMLAAESNDDAEIARAVSQIVTNCVSGEINVDSWPVFDVDYVFMHLKARAAGDITQIPFVCHNEVEGKECGQTFTVPLDIKEVKFDKWKPAKEDEELKINADWSVKMTYPKFGLTKLIKPTDTDTDRTLKTVYGSIEYFIKKGWEKPVYTRDLKLEQVSAFIDGLTTQQFDKLEAFITNVPNYNIKKTQKCIKCGFEHEINIEDPTSFF